MRYVLALLLIVILPLNASEEHAKLLDAIKQVESGGDDEAVGDNGRSLGGYQIQEAYFKDAQEFDSSLRVYKYEDVTKDNVARSVIRAYWRRYATEKRIGGKVTDEHRSRIHNGGPNGHKKKSTKKYWTKIDLVIRGK